MKKQPSFTTTEALTLNVYISPLHSSFTNMFIKFNPNTIIFGRNTGAETTQIYPYSNSPISHGSCLIIFFPFYFLFHLSYLFNTSFHFNFHPLSCCFSLTISFFRFFFFFLFLLTPVSPLTRRPPRCFIPFSHFLFLFCFLNKIKIYIYLFHLKLSTRTMFCSVASHPTHIHPSPQTKEGREWVIMVWRLGKRMNIFMIFIFFFYSLPLCFVERDISAIYFSCRIFSIFFHIIRNNKNNNNNSNKTTVLKSSTLLLKLKLQKKMYTYLLIQDGGYIVLVLCYD